MTDSQAVSLDLDGIEERANAATAGPWSYNLYSAIFAMGCWTEFDKWEDEQFNLGHTLEKHRKCDVDCGEHGCLLALEHYTRDPIICNVPSFMGDTALGNKPADAVFIADARTDIPDLIAEVRRLRIQAHAVHELHARNQHGDCETCGMQANYVGWPCPTIKALCD